MRWIVVLVITTGCKYPDPGFQMPGDGQPIDGNDDDAMVDAPAGCVEPSGLGGMVELPGIAVAGFSPADNESFAVSWLAGMTLGYTTGTLGATYSPTDLANTIDRAHLSPDGSAVYFFDPDQAVGQKLQRATRAGGFATWAASTWSGLADANPGRPTGDDQRIVYTIGSDAFEAQRNGPDWTVLRSYEAGDFGISGGSLSSANLSPDGSLLLFTVEGPAYGLYLRVRVNGTFDAADGAYGILLSMGGYRDAVFTQTCSRVFAFDTQTGQVVRWDVL
ncbi:MAG: hypothetical protein ACKV2T_32435 [Kofleriaceae bacterium]